MSCLHSDSERSAYFDGELSTSEARVFESHLETCATCQTHLAAHEKLRGSLREDTLYHRAPDSLLSALPLEVRGESVGRTETSIRPSSWWVAGVASAIAVAACVALIVTVLQNRVGQDDLIAQEIVASHVRALMADHLLDVPSLDRHTVKPWFDGKLDFAPPVVDTTPQGFPLIGGRLDYIAGRPVAAVVYKRDQHIINLFVWTSSQTPDESGRVMACQGYNIVRWKRSGMTFWAVSDLELTQLQQFAQAQHPPD